MLLDSLRSSLATLSLYAAIRTISLYLRKETSGSAKRFFQIL